MLQYLTFFPNLVSGPLVPFRQVGPMLDRLERPDSAATAALCRENGVDYLVDSLQYPGGVAEGEELALVYENESVKIYRVRE